MVLVVLFLFHFDLYKYFTLLNVALSKTSFQSIFVLKYCVLFTAPPLPPLPLAVFLTGSQAEFKIFGTILHTMKIVLYIF
jgi:hypothetical protein